MHYFWSNASPKSTITGRCTSTKSNIIEVDGKPVNYSFPKQNLTETYGQYLIRLLHIMKKKDILNAQDKFTIQLVEDVIERIIYGW